MKDKYFIPFITPNIESLIPSEFNDPFDTTTPEICKIAAAELESYIHKNQSAWLHNFGLDQDKAGAAKGKMFGVLVVEGANKEIGYLCTFSGKLQGEPASSIFVPSLFDISTNDYFMTRGMTELSEIGTVIKKLEAENSSSSKSEIKRLKEERKQKSIGLQQQLFDQYQFLNKAGFVKSLCDIFDEYTDRKPPAGTGECAAPKLLQYAYKQNMKPLAIAEFWIGKSTKSEDRKHGGFYPACEEKCRPILTYMLEG